MTTMQVTEWQGCYDQTWNGYIVPEAYAHPAKFARIDYESVLFARRM
jgi:hypothetical protein